MEQHFLSKCTQVMHAARVGFVFMVGNLLSVQAAFGFEIPAQLRQGLPSCSGPSVSHYGCAKAIETQVLKSPGTYASRKEKTLTIQLAGKNVQLVDLDHTSAEAEKVIIHSYLGYVPEMNAHVLHVQYYEGDSFMLIQHITGEIGYPSGFPFVSPDKTHFFATSDDMFAGYSPNNIEIWSFSKTGFKLLGSFEPDWAPSAGKWLRTNLIEISKLCFDEKSKTLLSPCGRALIQGSKSGWTLKD